MKFEFQELDLKGAYLIKGFYAGDNRGGFIKTFERDIYYEAGIQFSINETFASCSMKNVIRGLHFQVNNPQAKIVSVLSGSIWDVIVDLRPCSETFLQWRANELSAENHFSFYVPRGFAHGFASLENRTVMLYQCEGRYDKDTDTGIRYDDPIIGIDWPIPQNLGILSERDLQLKGANEMMKILSSQWQMIG